MISRWSRTRDAKLWTRVALLAGLLATLGLMAAFWGDWYGPLGRVAEDTPRSPVRNVWLDSDDRPSSVVEFSGAAHCGWQSATFIALGPLRQYVLDPENVVPLNGSAFQDGRPPTIEVSLPADAEPSGFRHGDREIWFSASEGNDAIYIVSPEGTQRWPRTSAGCI